MSGFLLSQYWLKADYLGRSRPDLKTYYKRRFLRIAPAYYSVLFLVLVFMMPAYISPAAIFSPQGAFCLGTHLIFAQYLFWLSAGSFNVLGPLWTVTIEMTFYFILPWLVILFLRNRWIKTLPIAFLITLSWLWLARFSLQPIVDFSFRTASVWSPNYEQSVPLIRNFLANQFPAQLVDFSLGIVLANLVLRRNLRINTNKLFITFTGKIAGRIYFWLGCFLTIYFMNKIPTDSTLVFHYYLSRISLATGFTLLIAGVEWGGNWVKSFFSFTYLRLIGLVGYSIYLLHRPLITIIVSYPVIIAMQTGQRFLIVLAIACLLVLIISMGFFLLVEKPFMVLGKQNITIKTKNHKGFIDKKAC